MYSNVSQKDLTAAQKLVVVCKGYTDRSQSDVNWTRVPSIASSSAFQFSAILLWPRTQTLPDTEVVRRECSSFWKMLHLEANLSLSEFQLYNISLRISKIIMYLYRIVIKFHAHLLYWTNFSTISIYCNVSHAFCKYTRTVNNYVLVCVQFICNDLICTLLYLPHCK